MVARALPRLLFLAAGAASLLVGVLLPVERVVAGAIPPGLEQSILQTSGAERLQALQAQFREGLHYSRAAAALLGLWFLGLGVVWPRLQRWRCAGMSSAEASAPGMPPTSGMRLAWGLPLAGFLLALVLASPLLTKGFEHEELLVHEMLARRGPLVTMAFQNLPPRAAQPAYTVIQSLVVRAFGHAEWVARLPALLFGATLLFPLYGIAGRLNGRRFAGLVCGLLLLTPFYHYYITYARGYPLGLAAFWGAVWACMVAVERNRWREWLLTGALLLVACYAHLSLGLSTAFLSLTALAHLGWLAVQRETDPVRRWISLRAALLPPVIVLGTTALLLLVAYAHGIPAERAYLVTFGHTEYYTAYHLNARFLRVLVTVWAPLRGVPAVAWLQAFLALGGVLLLLRRYRWQAAYVLLPCLGPVLVLFTLGHFIYPRFFLFYLPAYVIATVMALDHLLHRADRFGLGPVPGTVLLAGLLLVAALPGFHRLYRMERCGVRTAVEDAAAGMQAGDRLAGVLDAFITVRHYYPEAVSMFRDTDFWRELRGPDPPEFVISVPYLEMDIPGGSEALRARYALHHEYKSWLDVDGDHESVYLYRLKEP